jgi:hypothetical protein
MAWKIQPKHGIHTLEEPYLPFPDFSTAACSVYQKETGAFFRSPRLRFQNLKGCSVDVENHGL